MKVIGGILLFVPFVVVASLRGCAEIHYERTVGGHITNAAHANTIALARGQMQDVVTAMENNGMIGGFTSVIYRTPEEDVGYWYANLRAARDDLDRVSPGPEYKPEAARDACSLAGRNCSIPAQRRLLLGFFYQRAVGGMRSFYHRGVSFGALSMTPQQIDALPAGRELDRLVAESVFGADPLNARHGLHPDGDIEYYWGYPIGHSPAGHYSTDIATAWKVVEAMKAKGYSVTIWDCPEVSSVPAPGVLMKRGVHPPERYTDYGNTGTLSCQFEPLPVCICRCALKAVFAAKAQEESCKT